jgi:hypothetical protein
MAVIKHLCVVLQLVLIGSVLDNQVSATIPDLDQLRELVRYYLIPDFQQGGLVLPDHEQFAVAILQPNTKWLLFRYNPSPNNDGQKPVINPNYPRSPPDQRTYNNYLAARPDRGEDSEIQILDRIDDLYNAYRASHNNQAPKALLLYSWIVPCITCTDRIVDEFTRAPFSAIPTKVVAYTTNGGGSCSDCDVNYTENELIRAGIDFTKVYSSEQLMELANTMAKLMQG